MIRLITTLLLLTAICGMTGSLLASQQSNVRIEIQIVDYDGISEFRYSLSGINITSLDKVIEPDADGRVIINLSIDSTMFFAFIYRNAGEKDYQHRGRLVLQPGMDYLIVSEGTRMSNRTANMPEFYSPDIWSRRLVHTDASLQYTIDKAQAYYNMIDDNTTGNIYRDYWDMSKPDSLIAVMLYRIDQQTSLFRDLYEEGTIDKEFYEIAKLNVEYVTAYRLLRTIQYSMLPTDDTVGAQSKIDAWEKVYELFPVEGANLEHLWSPDRYLYVYMFYQTAIRERAFSPSQGYTHQVVYEDMIGELEPLIHESVYRHIQTQRLVDRLVRRDLGSMAESIEHFTADTGFFQTAIGQIVDQVILPELTPVHLLPEAELPEDAIFLDSLTPVNSLEELSVVMGNSPVLIYFWGSWCARCTEQLPMPTPLLEYLADNGIKIVFAAREYANPREYLNRVIAFYNITGYHLIINHQFLGNMFTSGAGIPATPSIMFISADGEVLIHNGHLPSEPQKLIAQIAEAIKSGR